MGTEEEEGERTIEPPEVGDGPVTWCWADDGALEVDLPFSPTRWTFRETARLLLVPAILSFALAAHLAANPALGVGAALFWVGMTALRPGAFRSRAWLGVAGFDVAFVALVAVIMGAQALAFIWGALALLALAELFGLFRERSVDSHGWTTRLWVDATRVRWEHHGPGEGEPMRYSLPIEAVQARLVRTDEGAGLELRPGLLLALPLETAQDLHWLVPHLQQLARARLQTTGPVQQAELELVKQLAITRPASQTRSFERWWRPLSDIWGIVLTQVAIQAFANGLRGALTATLTFLPLGARLLGMRDPWSPVKITGPLEEAEGSP